MFVQEQIEETGFSFSSRVPGPPERRREDRHLKILRVGVLLLDGRRELCLIRNISAGGLMAHVYSTVEEGKRVLVELKTHHQIGGRIMWVDEPNCGIEFDSPVDIAELLANPPVLDNGWRARSPRVEIDRLATLRAGARTYWVNCRDISQGGVRIECDQPLEPATGIVLTPEGFRPIAGVVRWQDDASCGISFNHLIPFAELIDWLKRTA